MEDVKTTCLRGEVEGADYNGGFRWATDAQLALTGLWELVDNRDPLNQVVVASGADSKRPLNLISANLCLVIS